MAHSDERSNRIAKFAIVTGFFAMLVIPLLQTATHVIPVEPVVENRDLAPWPAFDSSKGLQKYAGAGQLWFDDHFGFRSWFIRMATQVDYSIFDHSSRIHIGRDGWLYYRSVLDVEKPGIDKALPAIDGRIIAGVKELNRTLRERGVTLILAPIPLKDYFYPDFVPPSAPRLPRPHRFEMLYKSIQGIDDLFFVDTIRIVKEASKNRTTFHRTDFHWNDPAAFEVGKWIVDEIARRENRRESSWQYPLVISSKPLSGGQANFMPLLSPPSEMALFVEPSWKSPERTETGTVPPFSFVSRANVPGSDTLGPIVVLGDSFFDGLIRSGFMDYFSIVYRAETNRVPIRQLVDGLPPDCRYLLLEFIEVSLNVMSDLANFSQPGK